MEVRVQSIHFDASDHLQEFISKKTGKLEKKFGEEIRKVEVSLKVVKPETSKNKSVTMKVALAGGELFSEKVCDSFEECVDLCIDALLRQHSKQKEKQRNK
ncbi:MAG: ribosome-associated translation inhibitor RaiA [Bacteroidaceae bacterium]|nr:ribosome-associated translation inhibitor RaiA [Bacteroidaceae bacterium]MDO4956729.1 ribosome-associated translation inhibitor RaiA [Bacteroidales bacterium]